MMSPENELTQALGDTPNPKDPKIVALRDLVLDSLVTARRALADLRNAAHEQRMAE